jgi:putative N-acetylmannosamine-6-phosphate epimerase
MIKEKVKEKVTYDTLHKFKVQQDKLIAEGKIQKPQRIIRNFTSEEQRTFDNGKTLEEIITYLEQKHGKI